MISYDNLIGRCHLTVAVAEVEGSETCAYADRGQGQRAKRSALFFETRFMVS
jgi:hypothetical protein